MSELGSFADLASIKGNEVQKPKALPAVFYSAIITGPFSEHKNKAKDNFALRFPVKLVEALDDDAKVTIGNDELMSKAFQKNYTIDFWMSEAARYRFTEFAKAVGVSDELNLVEMAEEVVRICGSEPFLLQGTHSPNDKDPESPFFRLDNPAPMSAFEG